MKKNLWFARLFGIGMFLTVWSLNLFAQGTVPGLDQWRRIGPWGGDIRDIKMKIADSAAKATFGWTTNAKDSIVVAAYGAGVYLNDSAASTDWISRNIGLPSRKVMSIGIRQSGVGDTMYVGLDGYGVYRMLGKSTLVWEQANGTGVLSITGRSVYSLTVHPNKSWEVYAGTDQGLYKTTNSGATWFKITDIPSQLVSEIQIHEFGTGKIYCASGTSIYRSTNNGNIGSWTEISLNGNTDVVNTIGLAYSGEDTLFAGTQGGVLYEVTYPPPFYTLSIRKVLENASYPIYSMAINPRMNDAEAAGYYSIVAAADTLYVGTKYGFFKGIKQLDANYAWTQVNTSLNNDMVSAVFYYPGKSWSVGSTVSGPKVQQSWVFAGTGFNGFYKMQSITPGGGSSWTIKNDSLPVGGLRVVQASPLASDVVYTGGGIALGAGLANGAVWKSGNAVSAASPTWTRVFPPEDTATVGKYISSIATSYYNSNYVWVADSLQGIYKTTDAGTTWNKVYSGLGVSYLYTQRYIGTQPAADTEYVYASIQDGSGWKVLKSNKGGTAFTTISTTTLPSKITSIIVDSTTSPYVYATTWGSGVYRSTDGGNNFTRITTTNGTYNAYVYSLAVDSGANTLVIGTQQGIFKSVDRGANWTGDNAFAVGSGYALDNVYNVFSTQDTIWAALSGKGIYYRTKSNSGTGWMASSISLFNSHDGNQFMLYPQDTLQLRDLDFVWKWTAGTTVRAIDGYAASQVFAVLRRNNVIGTHPITNGTTTLATDSIYVYLPDTCSGVRGGYFDLPVRIINANKVDSFWVSVQWPQDYFHFDRLIQTGTLTDGLTIDTTVHVGADFGNKRFVCNNGTPFAVSTDTVLFKIRLYVRPLLFAGGFLMDSLPRTDTYAGMADSSIHLSGGHLNPGGAVQSGDSTGFGWRTSTDSNYTHFGLPGTSDSMATFWLRHLPEGTAYNGLPGLQTTLSEPTSTTGYKDGLGEAENTYGAASGIPGGARNPNLGSEKDWEYIRNTETPMTVGIRPSAQPKYPYLTWGNFPEKSIRTGDAIGAFYYRNDTLVCAGYGLWRADSGCVFNVFADDPRTILKDGFVVNEPLTFKIYDSRYKKVWPVPTQFTDGQISFVPGAISEISQKFTGKFLRDLYVDGRGVSTTSISPSRNGWHLISSYLNPVEPGTNVDELFRYVTNFNLLKDEAGNIYWPAYGINMIMDWNVQKAYWINYSADANNTRTNYGRTGTSIKLLRGTNVDLTANAITFSTTGWYLIPFLGDHNYPISGALNSIAGKFQVVTNDSGALYYPDYGQNQIGNMEVGRGYMIYIKTVPATLTYPSNVIYTSMRTFTDGVGIPELTANNEQVLPYFSVTRTSPSVQVLGIKMDGMTLREGDEIGVFTKDGICIGSAQYKKSGKNMLAVTVFGNDEFVKNSKTGAFEGEDLVLKLYVKSDKKEYTPELKSVNWVIGKEKGLVFKANSIASVSLSLTGKIVPMEYSLDQNYPNPFNPTTQIKYALPEDGFVKIKIFDMLGREVKELVNTQQTAGYYTIEWDGTNKSGVKVSTGAYLYKIEANKFAKSMKMMLMK